MGKPLGGLLVALPFQAAVSSGGASLRGFFGGVLTWPAKSRARP
jgi:hypothetical protein